MPLLKFAFALFLPVAAAVDFINCPTNITKNFTTAIYEAQDLASGAVSALNLLESNASTNIFIEQDQVRALYTKFFGDIQGEDSELSYVKGAFERAYDVLRDEKFDFHCDMDPSIPHPTCVAGAAAFVSRNVSDQVHLCPIALTNMSLPYQFSAANVTRDAANDTLHSFHAFYHSLPRMILHETMHLPAVGLSRHILDIKLTEPWDNLHLISCYFDFATLLDSVPGLASRNAENYASFALSIDLVSRDPRLLYPDTVVVKRPASQQDREALDCTLKKYVSDEKDEHDPVCWNDLGKQRNEAGVPDVDGAAMPSVVTFTGATFTTVKTITRSSSSTITSGPLTTGTAVV